MKLLLLWLSFLQLVSSNKILVYAPQLSRSHVTFMARVSETLAEAGNEVTMYSLKALDNVTVPHMKNVRLIEKERSFISDIDFAKFFKQQWDNEPGIFAMIQLKQVTGASISRLCESALTDVEMIDRFRKEKFDLGIAELVDPCGVAFFQKIGIEKYVTTDSLSLNEYITKPLGIDSSPSFVPTLYSPHSDKMTYGERVRNSIFYVLAGILEDLTWNREFAKVYSRQLGADFDSKKAIQKAAFVMVNSEEYLDYPRPITHKIIYIGGIGARKPEPLNEYYKNLLDNSKDGAVFVSFGSILKSETMPPETKNHFLQTFRNFPKIQFIWKYESDDTLGDDIKNLIKVKWAPQNDLLRHPNIRAFVTHGGLNSISETVNAGVPAVVIPMFGDQFRNAKMVAKRGVARIILKNNITSTSLTEALSAILYDTKYWKSAKRLQDMIRNKPSSAVERLVKYTEFAARFGHVENLDSASTELNFFQYYLIDVIVPLALICIIVPFIILYSCIYILKNTLVRKVKYE